MASEFALWPVCATCCMREYEELKRAGLMSESERVPRIVVEGYERVQEKARSPKDKYDIIIIADCHGRRQAARFGIPFWWGQQHELDAIKSLVFFKPGDQSVDHGMVTRFN